MSSATNERPLFLDDVGPDFPDDGPIADALEALVADTLPVIPGLHDTMSNTERDQVISATIAAQREAFVRIWGNAFGQTIDPVTHPAAADMPAFTNALRTAA